MNEFIVVKDAGGQFEVTNCAGSTYGMFWLEESASNLREMLNSGLKAQAEITRLNARVAELERELDVLSESHATCGKPECTPTKVCELFFKAGAA